MATIKKINQLPLSDVCLVRIITTDAIFPFKTSDEIASEEIVSEGEEQTLKIKGTIYANREAEDTVLGYDLTLKDNVMCPEVLKVVQGGNITYDSDGTTVTKYEAPPVGKTNAKEKFDTEIYTAIVGTDGDTGEFAKITFPSCTGASVPLSFKDGEYYSNEYKIKSRPTKGVAPYTIDIVETLPEDTVNTVDLSK